MTVVYPDLRGLTVVVTGGSRGIGAGTAGAFAAQGARVVVVGRDTEALRAVVARLEGGGRAVAADLTDPAAVARLRAEVGPADVLCAFAGGEGAPVAVTDLEPAGWETTVGANLTSAFLTVRAFLGGDDGMLARGSGAVVTMSSTAGRLASPASPAYGAAKAGVQMFTRQTALQVAGRGVRVNCIAPGAVLTDRSAAQMPPQVQEQVARYHPLQRLGTPADIASAALFLASDASSWITGVTLDVNGGRVMV